MKVLVIGLLGAMGTGTYLAQHAKPEHFSDGIGLVALSIVGIIFLAFKALK